MKRRILASLLALVMVLSMVPAALAAEELVPIDVPTPTDTTPEGDSWISGLADSAEIPTNLNNHDRAERTTLSTSDYPISYDDTAAENDLDLVSSLGTTFEINSTNYEDVMQSAKEHSDNNIVLVLTENLISTEFAGIPGKSVTATSQGNKQFSLPLATDLVGDITLDHVRILEGTVFANGHRFETTESVSGSIQCLYGGGSKGNHVDGDTTIILRGGTIAAYLFGGGLDSNVSGDAHIILDGQEVVINQLFGGGHAKETEDGCVDGDVTIDFRKGLTKEQFGGGMNEYDFTADVRTPAAVNGTVTVNFGYEGAPADSVRPGWAMYTKCGSYHSTVGNIRVNITDGVYMAEKNIMGCGYNDTVLGTVQMRIFGSPDMGTSHVVGGGEGDGTPSPLDNSGPIRILNQENDENALYILYDVPDEEVRMEHGILAGSRYNDTEINGDVLVELVNGNLDFIQTYDYVTETYSSITGRPKVLVSGGRTAQIFGDQDPAEGHKAIATVTDSTVEIGTFFSLGEVNIQNNAVVDVDSENFEQYGGVIQKPFYKVDNLNVTTGSNLTTRNSNTQVYNNVTMDHGTWHAKGFTYIYEGMYTKNSQIFFDTYYQIAYNHKGTPTEDTLLTSEGDTFVAMKNAYRDAIHCSVDVKDSTWAVLNPLQINGHANFENAVLQLPVVGNPENNYPKKWIPVEINGQTDGAAFVEIVEAAADGTDSSVWSATPTKPAIGDNYIVCWAPDGTDLSAEEKRPLQSVFLLTNDDAVVDGLYLKREKDADTSSADSYFMWQVAKGIIVTFDRNGGDTEASPKYIPVEWVDGQAEYQPGVPKTNPTRAGHTFKGWNTKADGTGDPYTAETKVNKSLTVYAQWEAVAPAPTYTVTYTDGVDNEVIFADQVTGGLTTGATTPAFNGTPTRDGYTFKGWLPEVTATVTGTVTYVAQWSKNSSGGSSGGGGGTTYYILHYESNGGTEYKDERYKKNAVVELDKVPTREGYTFTGWYADEELTDRITSIKMTRDKTVYAGWEPTGIPEWLNGDDHFAYVIGYTDGTVRPRAQIARSEVAAIFFRLLKPKIREEYLTDINPFGDVDEEDWYSKAVSTLYALDIFKGRTSTNFVPDAPITRAEFAVICARFDTGRTDGDSEFTDIAGHWAEAEIERAASLGWVQGDPAGRFHPDAFITRAEAMTMINRVLNRLPEDEDDLLDGMNVWPDNKPGDWYYLAVQEATNSHDFTRKGDVHERWTKLTADPDWSRYEAR